MRPNQHGWLAWLALSVVLLTAGCDTLQSTWGDADEVTTTRRIGPDSPESGEVTIQEPTGPMTVLPDVGNAFADAEPGTIPAVDNPQPGAIAVPPSSPQPAGKPTAGSTVVLTVTLYAGTSLPQSLPTGTAMSFSVDYNFRNRAPGGSSQYFWVIKRREGQPLTIPVPLKRKGNLVKIVPGWRPEQGPFTSYLLERTPAGQMRQVSKEVPMS